MADEDVTLDPAASDPVVEQPADQTVDAPSEQATDPASTTSTETLPEPKLLAGKYKTVEELEEGYRASNAENSRMAGDISRLRTPQAPAQPEPKQQYSAEQLETWKEARIREVAQNETRAARLHADGNYQDAQRFEAAAQESARQVRMIDKELRTLDIQTAMATTSKRTAEQQIMAQASSVLQTYKSDLVEGTPLYAKASEFLQGYGAMGQDVNSPMVQAQAVALAAQILGLSSKKVEQTTRKELTRQINTNLKAGVMTGTAKAATKAAGVDFTKMSDAEFSKYKADRGWD